MLITIRPVEDRDLEDLVDIAIASFEYDPQWQYRFPYRKEYCGDHRNFTRMYYTEYLVNTRAGDNIVMVAEAPSFENAKVTKVVAFGIWDNAPDPNRPAVKPPTTHFERNDGNSERMKAFAKKTMGIRQEVFMGKYKGRQMSLRQMATLPAYWKNGAATKLCKWGLEKAESLNLAMPLFASPLGQSLYQKFGFKELGTWYLQIDGDDAKMEIVAMVWEPPKYNDL
ncbi:hypothetical protein ABW20_dc0108514 [Dactylellina cionopaga]|nr:hypothetical protein ABW20_dc0108514 [Dactylellina cionopaga]